MRPREAYFINRHGTFRKEETFNFPEHQKFLKSIKNSSQKMKISEKFSENFISKNFRKSEKSQKSGKSEKSEKIRNFEIFEKP